MLTEKELNEIRKTLENSNNPLFFFDDDGDGLCAYLILKKHYKKGRGIPIKTAGPLNYEQYKNLIEEEKPDLIIILDKAIIKKEFFENCPCDILYIDHHPVQSKIPKKIKYFNPLIHNKDSYIPTSQIIYSVTKDNLWLAAIGCLFDYKIPEFIEDFKKQYADLITITTKDPGDILYKTELGKLIKLFAFNLKGKSGEVKKSLNALEKVESPYEILNQTTEYGKFLLKRFERLNKEFEILLKEAENHIDEDNKLILFIYPENRSSFTRDLATQLSYMHQDKTIIIGRERNNEFKLSLRNQRKDIRKPLEKALAGLEGYGGGHEKACGANIARKDFDTFIERIKKLI